MDTTTGTESYSTVLNVLTSRNIIEVVFRFFGFTVVVKKCWFLNSKTTKPLSNYNTNQFSKTKPMLRLLNMREITILPCGSLYENKMKFLWLFIIIY